MPLHILIPCKALASGKSRLSPMLSAWERAALCAALLERTLDCAIDTVPAERCHVVSADPAVARAAAARRVPSVAEPLEAGLNGALGFARDAICAGAPDAALLVLPIDLPLASPRALRRLVEAGGDVVAATDRRGLGTNALYLAAAAAPCFAFRFGPGSLAAHRAAAAEQGLGFRLAEASDLAFDLDEPADLREWRAGLSAAAAPRRP